MASLIKKTKQKKKTGVGGGSNLLAQWLHGLYWKSGPCKQKVIFKESQSHLLAVKVTFQRLCRMVSLQLEELPAGLLACVKRVHHSLWRVASRLTSRACSALWNKPDMNSSGDDIWTLFYWMPFSRLQNPKLIFSSTSVDRKMHISLRSSLLSITTINIMTNNLTT